MFSRYTNSASFVFFTTPLKRSELSSITAIFFKSPLWFIIIKVGTIIIAAMRTGARIVIIMNDFFLTLVTYSLLIITDILFIIGQFRG